MKAAIITAYDPFKYKGGIETFTIQLLNLLKDHAVETEIYHIGMVGERHDFHNDFIGRIYLLGRRLCESDREYDFIIANSFYGLGYFPPKKRVFNIYHSTHMGFAEGVKDVVSPIDYLGFRHLYGELCESVSGFDRVKIAVSESVRSELRGYYGFNDVRLVNHGIDTSFFYRSGRDEARIRLGIPSDAFVGLYVGRWDATKGCDILDRIISSERTDTFWVVVLGTGSDKRIVPARRDVMILEQIQYEKMVEIYAAADFAILPSRYEAFGFVILEAMACGIPLIAAGVGIAKTIYKNAPFNLLLLPEFAEGSEQLIEASIEKIALLKRDEDLRENAAKEGRLVVERDYSFIRWKRDMARELGISRT